MKFDKADIGFTPAYAGNTATRRIPFTFRKVHPRIRGEYLSIFVKNCLNMGSPPHTRGIRVLLGARPAGNRFTPAYAGNTLTSDQTSPSYQVHPRIRGEYCRGR